MVNPLWLLPALVVILAALAWGLDKTSTRGRRVVGRVALLMFGRFVGSNAERKRTIQAAYIDSTYRTYTAKTYLFALLGLFGGGIAGAYVFAGILAVLQPLLRLMAQLPRTISGRLGLTQNFELVLSESLRWSIIGGGGVVLGILVCVSAYSFRWQLPRSHAEVRRRSIEEGMPRMVAFLYALSRGGISIPDMLRTLGNNREVYGETANEMSIATREMDLFGQDIISAIRRMSRRTPSEKFKTFSENLASILQSGSNLSEFLREQYDRFQKDAEERQEEILELLATIAEGYVTVLVAGTLFLLTILMVFGLTTTDTLWLLQLMAYLMIPLANLAFMVFLAQKLEQLGIARRGGTGVLDRYSLDTPIRPSPSTARGIADGGMARDRATATQLRWYDRIGRVRHLLSSPVETIRHNPDTIMYLTVPIALFLFLWRAPAAFQAEGVNLRILDDLLVQSVLFLLATYAIVRTLYKRRIDKIEAATPELLERLASLNESGMTVVEGFDRVRGSDLGVLTPEIERIWQDINMGANVDDALLRFGRRVRTTSITRVVVLLTNAMRASGQMGKVLRIASDQARADLRLRRQRRRQMFTYLVVIYISFMVFLVIILAVKQVLVPSLPESVPTPNAEDVNRLGVDVDQFARIGNVDKAAYTLVFFHTALIQAICSGFIGGQIGEGTIRDGAKHAAILLGIAYVALMLLSSPVVSITAGDDIDHGETITLESVSISEGGFVVIRDRGINSSVIGTSEYLAPGTHSNVTIRLERSISDGTTIHATAHFDTNNNKEYDYHGPPWTPGETSTDHPYPPLANDAKPGIEILIP